MQNTSDPLLFQANHHTIKSSRLVLYTLNPLQKQNYHHNPPKHPTTSKETQCHLKTPTKGPLHRIEITGKLWGWQYTCNLLEPNTLLDPHRLQLQWCCTTTPSLPSTQLCIFCYIVFSLHNEVPRTGGIFHLRSPQIPPPHLELSNKTQ